MNVPAALTLGRLMVPDGFAAPDAPPVAIADTNAAHSTMEAIAQGTADGLKLLANVVAMLIVMVALVALANAALGSGPETVRVRHHVSETARLHRCAFRIPDRNPLVGGGNCRLADRPEGSLNELMAYLELAKLPVEMLSERSRTIMTYALCGFANFGSLGIMVGGLSAMVPERRAEIAGLGARSILSGLLSTLLTASIVGVVLALK